MQLMEWQMMGGETEARKGDPQAPGDGEGEGEGAIPGGMEDHSDMLDAMADGVVDEGGMEAPAGSAESSGGHGDGEQSGGGASR